LREHRIYIGRNYGGLAKNIFHVMFCAEHCVYVLAGSHLAGLGGRGTVGQGFAGCLGPGWSAALTAQAAGFNWAAINNPIFNATHQLCKSVGLAGGTK
jgi:hypothetical protein